MRDYSLNLAQSRDLTGRFPDTGRNELASMGQAISELVGTVRTLVQESHGYSSRLVDSAVTLGQVSDHTATAAHRQSAAASSSAASIEQVTTSIQMVSANIRDVAEQAKQVMTESARSSGQAEQAADETLLIANSITTTSQTIDQLNQRSGEIGNIVQVIREIADQTNLLALNAG